MNILYLSYLCSVRKHSDTFYKSKVVVSHAGQKYHSNIVNGLVAHGCNVTVVSQQIIDDSIYEENENGINYIYIDKQNVGIAGRISGIISAIKIISKWLADNKDGFVMCDTLIGEFSIAINHLKKFRRFESVAVVADVPAVRANETRKGIRRIPIWIKNQQIYKFDGLVFLSEAMNGLLNKKNKPYSIIEGIVNSNLIRDDTKKNDYKICMMAGSLEVVYGVERLLQAFCMVKDTEARLHFYGTGGAIGLIKEYEKKDNRIKYCGELLNDEIMRKEAEATLLINPRPNNEAWVAFSFPSKNIEYMHSGTPLLAFNLPCIPQEYQKYFYMFTKNEPESMANTIDSLLSRDMNDLKNFGAEARSWIEENKNYYVQTKKIINLLQEL